MTELRVRTGIISGSITGILLTSLFRSGRNSNGGRRPTNRGLGIGAPELLRSPEVFTRRFARTNDMNPVDVAASGLAGPGAEVTLWTMFLSAHFVVKLVMLGLLGASIWCWAIIINKAMLFSKVQKAMDRFEQVFWSGNSLEDSTPLCRRARRAAWPASSSPRCTNGNARFRRRQVHSWVSRRGSRKCST